MNDQAINDAYQMFSQGGYSGSIDNFKQLIASNPNALNDSYEIFKSGGYSNDIESFKTLMGVSNPSDPLFKKKSPGGESALADGSSDLPYWMRATDSPEEREKKRLNATGFQRQRFDDETLLMSGKEPPLSRTYEEYDNFLGTKGFKTMDELKTQYEEKKVPANSDLPYWMRATESDEEIEQKRLNATGFQRQRFDDEARERGILPTILGQDGMLSNDTRYRIKDGFWERLVQGDSKYEKITNASSISALNNRYSKDLSTDVASIEVKPSVIDPFLAVNSDFLSKTEEDAQTALEKMYGDYGFTFEQTGYGSDYIKVTPSNGAESKTFSFDEKSGDEAVRLQSFLRTNASFENEGLNLGGFDNIVEAIENNPLIKLTSGLYSSDSWFYDPDEEQMGIAKNIKYYDSDKYKQSFKELTYFQKKNELERRLRENTNIGGRDDNQEEQVDKENKKLYDSEEYKLFNSEKSKFEQQQEDRYSLLLDDYEIKKRNGDYEGAREAKLAIESGFSRDVIGDNVTNLSNSQYDLMSAKNNITAKATKLKEQASKGLITQEQYNIGAEAIIVEQKKLAISAESVISNQKKMDALAGVYATEKAKYGGFGSNLWNGFVIGLDDVREPLSYVFNVLEKDPLKTEATLEAQKSKIINPQQKKYYEDKGYNEEEIKNVFINNAKKDAIAKNKKAVIESIGFDLTTEESKSKLGFVENALVGVAASLPPMMTRAIPVIGQVTAFASMANMAYNGIEEEMLNDPDFETTSEAERALVAVPYAVVMGALENFGISRLTAGKSAILGKYILGNIAKTFPAGVTKEVLENIANKEIESLLGRGVLKIVGGTLAEGETGALQTLVADIGIKKAYNYIRAAYTGEDLTKLTGGEAFGTPQSFSEGAAAVGEGALAEAIGGFAMSTVMVGAQGLATGKISLYNQDDLKFFEDFSSDEEFKKLIVTKLKTEMLEGTMTKRQAQAALNDIDLVAGVFNSIDENLPQGAKLEAFNLINEKRRLEKEVEGKDPALSKKSNDRIAEINAKLEELPSRVQEVNLVDRGRNIEYALRRGKGKSKTVRIDGKRVSREEAEAELQTIITKLEQNAIQEQAAGEVLVQPTTEVGEEVVQGEPTTESQILAEESQKIKVEDIESKRIETEAKIKRKDLFSMGGSFSSTLGESSVNSVPTGHSEINGIEFVQFSNPNTGEVDVVMTGKSGNDFVGFYRIYENGKATNKWSSKVENKSRNKEDFKTMISGVQSMLPQEHEYTEKTSISTDGLRVWYQQLSRGYELQYDNKGNLITNRAAINGDAINNELGIEVNKGNFYNISVTNSSDMKKVKKALLPYLEKFGLNESNINFDFENGTVEIDLPVLKKSGIKTETTTATQEVVSEEVTPQAENLTLREKILLEAEKAKGKAPRATRVRKAPVVTAPALEVEAAPIVVEPTQETVVAPVAEATPIETQKEEGEFVVQGTFNGDKVVAGNKSYKIDDQRQIGQAGETKIVETVKNGKKIFTLVSPHVDGVRMGYLGVSIVLPENTKSTADDLKSILEEKQKDVLARIEKTKKGPFDLSSNMEDLDLNYKPVVAPVVAAPKAEGAPTAFSWPKIKEYTSEVIRSMRQVQFAKLNPLLELKKPSPDQIIEIKALQAKIKAADAVLTARENKIKEDEKKAEKGEPTDKSPRVSGVDQNGKPAEFSIVVNEKKQTAKVQLKKRGDSELARQKVESDLKIQTDNKGRRFVETQNKSRVYIDEKVTPPKAEVKAPTPKAAPKAKAAPKEAPIVEAKVEPVVEPKAEPVKKPTVTAEDRMNVIKSLKEQIEETTNEIKETRAKARKAVNEIEAKILDTKNENQKEELQFDIVDIETQLEEDLEGLKDDLDRQVAMLKEEVGSLKESDIKKPENKNALVKYIDAAIKTLNGLNELTYAKLDAGVTLGTLKLILQGIREIVIKTSDFNTAVREMAKKYKSEHDNKKITIAEFVKEINDYLDSTYVDPQNYEESLDKDIDKFTTEIKNAIRQAQSQSKALREKAAATIKDMLKGKFKSISAVHMRSIMTRLVNINVENQTQYDKFLEYVDKVIEIANYDTKVREANVKRKKAKDNTVGNNPKLGDLSLDLLGSLSRMLNINPKLISREVFDSYYNIVDDLSKRTTILSPGERADLNEKVNEIVDSIEQNEEMLPNLKDVYDNYADKVVKNGVVNYAKTLTQMLEDGVINNNEFTLMKKYKSKIVDAKVKVKMTEQEIADEKAELINEITNTPITLDAIVGDEFRLERELVKRLAKLLNKESLENLDNKQLKDLIKILDNINDGFVSKSTQQMVEILNEKKNSSLLVTSIPKSVKGIFKKITQPIRGVFTRDKYGVNINPLFNIDEVFGDFKTKNIFNSVLNQSAVSQQQFQSEVAEIQGKLKKAESAIASSFNRFSRNENKIQLSKFKMMVYMMQLEFESNPNSKQVHQAMKTLDATIDFAETNKDKSRYTKEDIDQMKAIKKEFEKDGEIDIDKLYNSFNSAEKNALKVFDEINSLMTKKATYTATVINGNKIAPLKNYIYYNTISDSNISEAQINNLLNNTNPNQQKGTESKNLEERTGKVSPVDLNPFAAVNSSAKSVLVNYHMTEPIRTARKTLLNARKILEENKKNNENVGEQFDILSVIEKAYDTATKDLLETNLSESSNTDAAIQYLTKAGYRAMLGSATRALAELTSNAAFVTTNNPKDMAAGFKYIRMANSGRGKNILTNLKSKVTSRNYPEGGLSSNYVNLSAFKDRTVRDGKSRTKYVNGVKQIFDFTAGNWVNFAELIADNLISRPDQMVMKQLYFGAFSREFKKETGVEPDFEKIEANDEEYMDKYQDALEKATNQADNQTVTAGSSMNAYMGLLQNVVRKGDRGGKAAFKTFNQFMNRFTIQEYITARKGVKALIGKGDITQAEGAQVLAAVSARMTLYLTAGKLFSQSIIYLAQGFFGWGDDDDDDGFFDFILDGKTPLQMLYQSAVSSATTLFFGRNFGNVVRAFENVGIEQLNKEYGEDIGLRNGEYDPFKDAVQYNQFSKADEIPDVLALMAGPLGPVINAGTLGMKLLTKEAPKEDRAIETRRKEWYRFGVEAAGSVGLVPFYRDVRKVTMDWVYDELKKELKEDAAKKAIKDEKDANTLETKTNTLNRMKSIYKDEASRRIIDYELKKLSDPDFRKEENKKEDDEKTRLANKYGYESMTEFEYDDKEKYDKVFGDDSPYRKRMAPIAKIRQELEGRMKAAKFGKPYKPTEKTEKKKQPVDAFESNAFESDAFKSNAFESNAFETNAFGKKRKRN